METISARSKPPSIGTSQMSSRLLQSPSEAHDERGPQCERSADHCEAWCASAHDLAVNHMLISARSKCAGCILWGRENDHRARLVRSHQVTANTQLPSGPSRNRWSELFPPVVCALPVEDNRWVPQHRQVRRTRVSKAVNLSAYAGRAATLRFLGAEDSSLQTTFLLDDITIAAPVTAAATRACAA